MLNRSQTKGFLGRAISFALVAVLAALPVVAVSAPRANAPPVPLFLSTDVGCEIDDQWVLLHLLTDARFDVRVIASAHAPVDGVPAPAAETTAATARQIVERMKLVKPPRVVTGSNEALVDDKTPRDSEAVLALLQAARSFNQRDRLTVLITGAATDVASALLKDPTLGDRIRIVAMGFQSYTSGDEYNIKNDPAAWRVILNSQVPLVIGDAEVTAKKLSLTRDEAKVLLQDLGPTGEWLLADYDAWYAAVTHTFENPGRPGTPRSWPIWDEVVVAHLLGMTSSEVRPRPTLTQDLKLVPKGEGTVVWITDIERDAVFGALQRSIAGFVRGKRFEDHKCVTVAREPDACWRKASR
jgi:inosine-uridine nucleoside N-ribohydrolase